MGKMKKRFYIEMVGCQVAKNYAQKYAKLLRLNNWEEVGDPKIADLIVYSTCGVVNWTEEDSINGISNLKKVMKEGAEMVVTGCLPVISPERLSKVFNGVTFTNRESEVLERLINSKIKIEDIVSNNVDFVRHHFKREEIAYSEDELAQEKIAVFLDKLFNTGRFKEIYNYSTKMKYFWGEEDLFEILAADGCNNSCSYCATRFTKGYIKSKNPNKIAEEFKAGLKRGFKKFLLIGDELGDYGSDINTSLPELIKRLAKINSEVRVAIRYINPELLVKHYRGLKPFFKSGFIYFFCAPFQSGSPRVLKLMNRDSDIESFARVIDDITRTAPDVIKNTMIIIGFPTETEEDLEKTLDLVSRGYYNYTAVAGYDDRPNVPSSKFKGKLPKEIIDKRYKYALKKLKEFRARNLWRRFQCEIIKRI